MTNPLHAAYYADRAVQQTVEIIENVRLARDTYRVRFYSPEIARRILTVRPTTIQPLCVIKHTITRYRITVEAHQVRVKRQPMKPSGSGHWLTLDEVELLPLTSAHRKILRIKLETGQV